MQISLKAARVNAGYTVIEAAKKLNVSAVSLSNYEKGAYYPKLPLLFKMVRLYGVKIDDVRFPCEEII